MVYCAIKLQNNDRAVYGAGDLLKGIVELHVNQPKKFRGLYCIVHGGAKCHWSEAMTKTFGKGKERRSITQTVHFRGEDVYLNEKTYLFGSKEADAIEFESGVHRYEFMCKLPPELPSSIEESHGHVRYSVEAVLDVPWGFEMEYRMQFTVVRKDDLNECQDLELPTINEEFKRYGCYFCKSEPLIMTVTLPYSGFTPGQRIPITVRYNNRSNVQIKKTNINLTRIVRFTSSIPITQSKYEGEKIIDIDAPGAKPSEIVEFERNLLLPNTLVNSNSKYCEVVQIYYELEVVAELSGSDYQNIEMTFLIEIGSIPLYFGDPMVLGVPLQPQPLKSAIKMNGFGPPKASSPELEPLPTIVEPIDFIQQIPPPTALKSTSRPPTFEETTKMNQLYQKFSQPHAF